MTRVTSKVVEPLTGSATPRTASRALSPQPLGVYKCGAWRATSFPWAGSGYFRDCARFATLKQIYDVDYRTEAFNEFYHQSVNFTCKHAETTTWTYSVSATVKAEAGVIFAKAEASATAGVARSVSTTKEASASIEIHPRSWVHCTRGAYRYKFTGNVRSQWKKTSGGQVSWWKGTYDDFSGSAPSRTLYTYGPGRL